MTRFDPQVQLRFVVNSVAAIVIPWKRFTLRRYRKHNPNPGALVVHQPRQPIGNDVVFIQFRFVSAAGLANAKCLARQLDHG